MKKITVTDIALNFSIVCIFFICILNFMAFREMKYINKLNNGFYTENATNVLSQLSDIKALYDKMENNTVIYKDLSYSQDIRAILFKGIIEQPPVKSGRFFVESDFLSDNKFAVVGKHYLVHAINKGTRSFIEINKMQYEIIGVIGDKKDSLLDYCVLINMNGLNNLVTFNKNYTIDSKNPKKVDKLIESINASKTSKPSVKNIKESKGITILNQTAILSFLLSYFAVLCIWQYNNKNILYSIYVLGFSHVMSYRFIISNLIKVIIPSILIILFFALIIDYKLTTFIVLLIMIAITLIISSTKIIHARFNVKTKSVSNSIYILLIILTSSFLLFVQIAYYQFVSINKQYETNKFYTENNSYHLVDNILGKNEQDLFNKNMSVMMLKEFNQKLSTSDFFTYYEIVYQSAYIENFSGIEKFKRGYENGKPQRSAFVTIEGESIEVTPVKSVHLSANVLDDMDIYAIIGRSFTKNEYMIKNNEYIPVLLGYEYKDIYNVGDKFKVWFIGRYYDAEVIGVLSENTEISINDEVHKELDRYLIFPSFGFTNMPIDNNDKNDQFNKYMTKNNGYITSNKPIGEIQNIILGYADSLGMRDLYTLIDASSIQTNILRMSDNEVFLLNILLGLISLIMLSFVMFMVVLILIDINKKEMMIHIICGASDFNIIWSMVKKMLIVIIISHIVSNIFMLIFLHNLIFNLSVAAVSSTLVLTLWTLYNIYYLKIGNTIISVLKRGEA